MIKILLEIILTKLKLISFIEIFITKLFFIFNKLKLKKLNFSIIKSCLYKSRQCSILLYSWVKRVKIVSSANELKKEILKLTRVLQKCTIFRPANDEFRGKWESGHPIPYAGRVFTEDEVEAAVYQHSILVNLAQKVHQWKKSLQNLLEQKTLLVNLDLAQT